MADDAAAALARHRGRLSLTGLQSLSRAAAAVLVKHQGEVQLNPSINAQATGSLTG